MFSIVAVRSSSRRVIVLTGGVAFGIIDSYLWLKEGELKTRFTSDVYTWESCSQIDRGSRTQVFSPQTHKSISDKQGLFYSILILLNHIQDELLLSILQLYILQVQYVIYFLV